ncbi:hypothetical protein DYB37_006446 [Aphanomyces astaci]|uniref:HTH CENPB-type domain-containing protein n=1 Tax=Aphanomyces astaci TaxID=112090 RepID=A0A418DGP6_APHAT|nr:hypothetical protein DYB35_011611 [Aphanomyces astaci]RHZ20056.1 hypothetical protein DYB37_006446 [Aphanomyces astaci]
MRTFENMPQCKQQGNRLSIHEKNWIRAYYASHVPIKTTAVQQWVTEQLGHTLHITTIRRILRDKHKIETYNIKEESAKGRSNFQGPKYPKLDKQVAEWVVMANAKNACVTGELIARKGLQIATELNLQNQVKYFRGWLYRR